MIERVLAFGDLKERCYYCEKEARFKVIVNRHGIRYVTYLCPECYKKLVLRTSKVHDRNNRKVKDEFSHGRVR